MVNELREEVTSKLVQAIEPPIRRKCEAFVKKNQHVGTGVRNRILELFALQTIGCESAAEAGKLKRFLHPR